jgi:hypothetical protein
MHGRMCFAPALVLFALTSCSPNSLMKPDCHSCTVEEQEWKEFSWNALLGRWKGSVQNMRNIQGAKKTQTDKPAELSFLTAENFAKAHSMNCPNLPANALVLNGQFWETTVAAKEYEAFVPAEDGKVAYGRVNTEKVNGKDFCHFRRFGRVMGKNRLNLPTVSFSDRAITKDRMPASLNAEQEISVEFLRFATAEKPMKAFQSDGRRPASAKEQERPPLILRVFRVSSKTNGERGEWSGTEEYIYRLWKTE